MAAKTKAKKAPRTPTVRFSGRKSGRKGNTKKARADVAAPASATMIIRSLKVSAKVRKRLDDVLEQMTA